MSDQPSSPQRHATRAPVDRPVRLQFDDTLEVVDAACRNISIGGMFIRSTHCRPAGSLVRFELDVDDGSAIRGLAEVVWMRSRDGGPGHEAGMGVKFRFLEQRDRQQIFKLVSQHIKDRLATRQPFADSGLSGPPPAGAEPPPTVRPPQRPGPTAPSRPPTAAGLSGTTGAAPGASLPGADSTPGFGPPPVMAGGREAAVAKELSSTNPMDSPARRAPEDPPEKTAEADVAATPVAASPEPVSAAPAAAEPVSAELSFDGPALDGSAALEPSAAGPSPASPPATATPSAEPSAAESPVAEIPSAFEGRREVGTEALQAGPRADEPPTETPLTAPAPAPPVQPGQQRLLFDATATVPDAEPSPAPPAEPTPSDSSAASELFDAPSFGSEEPRAAGPAYDPPDFDTGSPGPTSDPELSYGEPDVVDSAPAPARQAPASEGLSELDFEIGAGRDSPMEAAPAETALESASPMPVTDPATLAWDAIEGSQAGTGHSASEGSAAEGDDPYYQHLGDDHFDHRPAPRKEMPWIPALALGLVLIGALAYLFGGQIFDWIGGDPTVAPVPAAAGASSGSDQDSEPARGATGSPSAANPGATAAPGGEGPESGQPASRAPSATAGAPDSAPLGAEPRAALPPSPPPPRPAPPPPPPAPTAAPAFTELTDIGWTVRGNSVEVTLTTNGRVDSSKIRQFRLDGPPRSVVRLLGVRKAFPRKEIPVDVAQLGRIRTGWHRDRSSGPELHVVFDLKAASWRIRELRAEGSRVVVVLGSGG